MTMSPKTSTLVEPAGEGSIPLGTLGYFRARNRGRVHDLVLREFERAGISRATLARRLKKRPEVVTRMLGGPGNWTLDTVSDLLFAIAGGEPSYTIFYPLNQPPRNQVQPEWLDDDYGELDWATRAMNDARRDNQQDVSIFPKPKEPTPTGLGAV